MKLHSAAESSKAEREENRSKKGHRQEGTEAGRNKSRKEQGRGTDIHRYLKDKSLIQIRRKHPQLPETEAGYKLTKKKHPTLLLFFYYYFFYFLSARKILKKSM